MISNQLHGSTLIRKIRRTTRWPRVALRNIAPNMRGTRDAKQLRQIWPAFEGLYRQFGRYDLGMRSKYRDYIANVSAEHMAVSWETARVLRTVACLQRPERILDLGSGFSSYVLRSHIASHPGEATVYSVDDSSDWLKQTGSFLAANGIATDHLYEWSRFSAEPQSKFDLIFHDLGTMQVRAKTLPMVLKMLSRDGVLVLDDMHRPRYRRGAVSRCRGAGLSLYSAREYSLDGFGRYCEIAMDSSATGGKGKNA